MVNNKLKICFIISSLANEGPTNVMYNIVKYINYNNFKVSIITLTPEKANTRIREFQKFPIDVFQLSLNNKKNLFSLYILLRKKVLKINPLIIHSHCPRSLYLMSFLPSKYKTLYTIHIYPGLQQKILYGSIKGKIIIFLNNFFTKRCSLPIACSESVSELFKSEKKIEILSIPNGSSLETWDYNQNEKNNLRNELRLNKDFIYFIFIGRLSKEKNLFNLIQAFANITNEKIRLIILGDGNMWEELYNIKPKNVIMLGFKTNVYDYLKASDYYISTSHVEGLANTLLESMTVGLPMILSDIPSHHEILKNFKSDETVGIIIDQDNQKSIQNAILKIIGFDSEKIRKSTHKVFLEKYTAKRMSKAYQDQYLSFL